MNQTEDIMVHTPPRNRQGWDELERMLGEILESCPPDAPDLHKRLDMLGQAIGNMSRRTACGIDLILNPNCNMLTHILDSVPQSVFWKDRESVYLGCNNAFARRAGLTSPEEVVGKTDYDLPWLREESDAYRADDREVMERNQPKVHIEEMQQQSDGTRIWADTTKVPLVNDSGEVYGVLGIYKDITDRKQAEMREETRLRLLEQIATGAPLEDLLVHIVTFVEQQNPNSLCSVLLANEGGTRLLHGAAPHLPDAYNRAVDGLKVGYGIGACGTAAFLHKRVICEDIEQDRSWRGFTAARDAGLRACWSEPILSPEGELLGTFASYYRTPQSPDHRETEVVESAAHLAAIAIGRVRASEKHHALEEQLRHMQKIEAIGQLTGGIAHDFNNMLTPVFVYAEMIRRSFPDEDPNLKKIENLISSAQKAKEITQKLLSFSRKQTLRMAPLDLNEVIGSFQELLRSTIRESITIDLNLSTASAHIFGDRGQLEQVIVNLALNAQDAIAENGRISIRTGHVMLDREYANRHPGMKTGPHVVLAFSDTGCGMGEEILNHLFEPFFTTKTIGYGTGLGLATAYGIIKQHDGYIQVASRSGEGTTFTIYLPEYRGAALPLRPEEPAATELHNPGPGRTVLIVDDNLMLLEMAVELLESNGYSVLSANTPAHALEAALSCETAPDLLITDVVMPEMSGPDLYKRIAERFPGMPVLFISGYTFDLRLQDDTLTQEAGFLPKPFTSEQFLQRIQQTLQ